MRKRIAERVEINKTENKHLIEGLTKSKLGDIIK